MCGLYGIINQEPQPFDYKTFCTLGLANDRRGGDSCGIFIDGKVEYGIESKSKFEDFFWTSELLNTVKTATIILGHDRKASVGGVSLEKAHPIIIKEKVSNSEENSEEEIKFVMIHNGTIHNYEELAKKYIPDIDVKNMSDSQVIARLIYYTGFDWLAEYNGGAAFVAVDYRNKIPKIYIWRGESKKYVNGQVEEERPLYCNITNNRLVFSSIASYLAVTDGDCYIVPANKVLTYQNGKFYTVKDIDRSKAQQNKVCEHTNYSTGTYYTGTVISYMTANSLCNTYRLSGDNLDGYTRLSNLGRVLGKYDVAPGGEAHVVYFFNGIPLIERQAYIFLCKALKRTKLKVDEFTKNYQNFIRYFSPDKVYPEEFTYYEAVGPFKQQLFTGSLQMLGESTIYYFNAGVKNTSITRSGSMADSFKILQNVPKIDYKTVWKEFIQSMK